MIIIVKPADGIVLHDPGNFYRPIAAEGSPVEDNSYWRRRIADGDAVVVPDAPVETAPPPPATQGGAVKPAAPVASGKPEGGV